MRVPLPTVSIVDFVFEVEKETTAEEVNKVLKEASENELKGILRLFRRAISIYRIIREIHVLPL